MVDQLQRRERAHRGAIALRLGQPIDDALAVKHLQTLEREWRAGTVTQQIPHLLALLRPQTVAAEDKLQVYTLNYPPAFFAERIAGDLADVWFRAPSGVDPAFWMSDADSIAAYQNADLIFLNGADCAPETGDFLSVMSKNANNLKRIFQ